MSPYPAWFYPEYTLCNLCVLCGWWCLNLRGFSLRFSAYLCVLCVYVCFNAEVAEVRRGPQRKTELDTTLWLIGLFTAEAQRTAEIAQRNSIRKVNYMNPRSMFARRTALS